MSSSFLTEEHMKPVVAAVAHRLSHRRTGAVQAYFEVPALRGIPDVVVVDFDLALASRMAVPETALLQTWIAASALVGPGARVAVRTKQVASATGLSEGHVSGTCLPRLRDLGFVAHVGRGDWHVLVPFRDRARTLVTVELKRRDWKQAVRQAALHGRGADRAWVVMDEAWRSSGDDSRVSRAVAAAGRSRVGLASVEPSGRLRVQEPASVGGPDAYSAGSRLVARAVLAERAWDLEVRGLTSGPMFPVFGRCVKTSAAAF